LTFFNVLYFSSLKGVTIKPVAGTALMFDHLIDGNNDEPNVNIWHAGCNVVGENDQKIILQKFKEKKSQPGQKTNQHAIKKHNTTAKYPATTDSCY
jgi:hypothetical protein